MAGFLKLPRGRVPPRGFSWPTPIIGEIESSPNIVMLYIVGKEILCTLKVFNFAGIKFRDFAIFSLNREIKYQGETFQVYNREIKYPRNLISGGF